MYNDWSTRWCWESIWDAFSAPAAWMRHQWDLSLCDAERRGFFFFAQDRNKCLFIAFEILLLFCRFHTYYRYYFIPFIFGIFENSDLLGCYAISLGKRSVSSSLRNIVPSPLRQSKKNAFFSWTVLKIEVASSCETSVRSCIYPKRL